MSTVQEQFYISAAGVGCGGREMVTLAVSKDAEAVTGDEVDFLTDTWAKCNLLPLDVYKEVTGDMH